MPLSPANDAALVHVFPRGNPHHVAPMIRWLHQHADCDPFRGRRQRFLLCGDAYDVNRIHSAWAARGEQPDVTIVTTGSGLLAGARVVRAIGKADRVVCHSLFPTFLPHALALRPAVASRTAWIMWGADMHSYVRGLGRRRTSLRSAAMRRLLGRLGVVGALAPGDFERLAETVPSPPPWVPFVYGLAVADDVELQPRRPARRVMLGNSAAESNRHVEALEWMAAASDGLSVVVPLGYGGSPDYVERVVSTGRRLFGARFEPVLTMLEPAAFDRLLDSVDILVFNHLRQQGLYSLGRGLEMGQKVFLRGEAATYGMFKSQGFRVFDTSTIQNMTPVDFATPLTLDEAEGNRDRVQKHRGEVAALEAWSTLLERLNLRSVAADVE